MTQVTITVDPDELLGIIAVMELDTVTRPAGAQEGPAGDAGETGEDADGDPRPGPAPRRPCCARGWRRG
jgi:hypothetical protein